MKTKPQIEDYELIRNTIEGDTTAFRQLVYKYKDVSLSLAYSILKNKAQSEDVLQDAFIKVFNKLDTFKFKSSFSTWLYRIVVNTAYNELKKQKPKVSIDDTINEGLLTPAEDEDHLKEKDQKRYINLALERMRIDEALVLRLFYLCELSIKEIEAITKFKTSKIKIDLHRGRENLSFQLKQLLGNDIKHLL
ncbi:MAG: sigma-70 family RNA polymerase sigma factor [Winogradskyella sp.]|uniref:RNA polymerase sigma factor n=1 Tax=Winogradskyella sp. TaxID=1883156 RepID=UPI000F3E3768|nr:sigma-70 family RNA polymerase sigma factor [Winogradskyella sp.]RNC88340.1 MAG: sigma-70 family RNA polymerase sigma factor [Winogradskyella sp.]